MVAERRVYPFIVIIMAILLILASFYGCKSISPFAISGSTFTLNANPSILLTGGKATITVIGTEPSGNPIRDGTVVYFTASAGDIESTAEFRNGIATTVFIAPPYECEVVITAQSGSVTGTVKVSVISKEIKYVLAEAHPSIIPKGGGRSKIIATVLDSSFSPIKGIPVSFSTDQGYFRDGGEDYTGSDGKAYDYLITDKTANVTIQAGDKEANIRIPVEGDNNEIPTASFEYQPQSPVCGERVVFDASSSADPDGYIVNYSWDFGDGNKSSGKVTDHRYKCDYTQTYVVVLTVHDNDGATDTEIKSIAVTGNKPPIADFTYSPSSPAKGQTVIFDASPSYDPDGDIVSYKWDFGDGNEGEGRTVTHVYNTSGDFVVTLTVRDNGGKESRKIKTVSVGE